MNKTPFWRKAALAAAIVGAATASTSTHAIALIDGLDGDSTYGNIALNGNDDGSSNELNLPFNINFYGTNYDTFYVNNNGNISFNGPVGTFTPNAFPNAGQPLIAPYWADVDTRCDTCGDVYVGSPNDETVVVTWNDVGYFSNNSDKTNNFQLALRDQGDGDFDIEFRFDRLEWTTGSASGGSGGLGGTPAQSGFDAGNLEDFFTLPGSRTSNVLSLQNNTNVGGSEAGFWSFAIRNGATPGETAANPLLPVVLDGTFTFDFNIDLDEQIFIDPEVAIGYDFEVQSGPNFASVLLPNGFGDDEYELWTQNDEGDFVLLTMLSAGDEYDFAAGGVDLFRVLGIEPELGVDPTDGSAFVTGLTFVSAGNVNMTQTPITEDTDNGGNNGGNNGGGDPANVPEPGTAVLMLLGSAFMLRRRVRIS